MKKSFVIKGTICHTPKLGKLEIREDAYVVCEDGICAGVFGELPERFADLPLLDHTGKAVIPGLVDLHIHAPQYAIRGTRRCITRTRTMQTGPMTCSRKRCGAVRPPEP